MSVRTLPLLFLNLGGEMLYVLDQRLRAQNIPGDKARKDEWTEVDRKRVLNDIISTMFNRKFMEELFKPQELYSKKALRTVYDRLAHASIMRLNQASMDKTIFSLTRAEPLPQPARLLLGIMASFRPLLKPIIIRKVVEKLIINGISWHSMSYASLVETKLYDLMTMAFKYQVLLCPRPKDVLLVTFNHLDSIKGFIQDSPTILHQVDETFRQLLEIYGSLSAGEFQLIRQTLLIFFQDLHIRVSTFLKDKVQNSNGRFVLPVSGPVPWGTEVPGVIRMFNDKGEEVKKIEFKHGGDYVAAHKEGSFELYGNRVLKLGTNMYSVNRPVETHMSAESKNLASRTQENIAPNPLAKEELNFLARLMGGMEIKKTSGPEPGFRLNLFTTDEEEEHAALSRPEELSYEVINIQATQDQQRNEELARIMGEFEITEQPEITQQSASKGDDLLAMMDRL